MKPLSNRKLKHELAEALKLNHDLSKRIAQLNLKRRRVKRCRHIRANVKLFGKGQSWEWCGMCGAIRELNPEPIESAWVYPTLIAPSRKRSYAGRRSSWP